MGKIQIHTGSKERRFGAADDPLLAGAIMDPAFGAGGQVGAEIEFIVFERGKDVSLGQEGASLLPGDFLRRLHVAAGAGAVLQTDPVNDYPCGVVLPNGGRFCLENGGQVEYASSPQPDLDALADELKAALALCETAAGDQLVFLGHGTHPTLSARLDPLVPSSRYRIMERFFAPDSIHRWGNHACSIQVNLDVAGVAAWREALRLGFALSPFAYQLFGNSAFVHGQRHPDGPARLMLTRQMDRGRRAVPPDVVLAEDPAAAYRDWALDVPVIFAGELPLEEQPRQGELSFRRWLEQGFKEQFPDYTSWLAHLGTLWPDVRPRRFIEFRAADMQPFEHVGAVIAFWQAFVQDGHGRARLAAHFEGLGGLEHLLSLPYDAPLFADPTQHAALLELAARSLSPRWASALMRYGTYARDRAAFWDTHDASSFCRTQATPQPGAGL